MQFCFIKFGTVNGLFLHHPAAAVSLVTLDIKMLELVYIATTVTPRAREARSTYPDNISLQPHVGALTFRRPV